MKRALALSLAFALLLSLLPAGAYAEPATPGSSSIRDNGNSLFQIDPQISQPDDYKKIVGFELTIELLEELAPS